MKSLSNVSRTVVEKEIHTELLLAGVPVVDILAKDVGRVDTTIGGKIGEAGFFRGSYYWIVSCRVPLDIANGIYATDLGQKDIRAGGDAGCRSPEEWAEWFAPDGKKLVNIKEKEAFGHFIEKGVFKPDLINEYCFAQPEDFPNLGTGYVTCYHVDSQEGLNFLVETLKKHNLV